MKQVAAAAGCNVQHREVSTPPPCAFSCFLDVQSPFSDALDELVIMDLQRPFREVVALDGIE